MSEPIAGPTGEFPDGKLNDDDEGALAVAIFEDRGNVVLDFGKNPVAWMAMDPDGAIDLATKIAKLAVQMKTRTAKPL